MKRAFYNISSILRFDRFFAFLNRNQPIVLAFHGVSAETPGRIYNYEGSHLHRPIFQRLVEHLASHYHIVSLDQIVDWLEGEDDLPERSVVITFDDGYRNVLTQAAPILFGLDAPATVFVTTDFVVEGKMLWPDRLLSALAATSKQSLMVEWEGEKTEFWIRSDAEKIQANIQIRRLCKSLPDHGRRTLVDSIVDQLEVDEAIMINEWDDYQPLGEDDLRKLGKQGIAVGSHTCSHPVLARCSTGRMVDELQRSKRIIEQITGRPCSSFSYPNGAPGDFNEETRREIIAAGYRCAVTTVKSRVTSHQDRFEIPRYILTHNEITMSEFSVEVSGFPTFLRGAKQRFASH
jgi:peptidoglycan/xylan/chitin deacetylase (PgdA/CDA1 family)